VADYPVNVHLPADLGQNRLWGIPILGTWVRAILVIPQADSIVSYVGGYYRWAARVASYVLLLTGKYPPFRLSE
jgi:hypothetical protein